MAIAMSPAAQFPVFAHVYDDADMVDIDLNDDGAPAQNAEAGPSPMTPEGMGIPVLTNPPQLQQPQQPQQQPHQTSARRSLLPQFDAVADGLTIVPPNVVGGAYQSYRTAAMRSLYDAWSDATVIGAPAQAGAAASFTTAQQQGTPRIYNDLHATPLYAAAGTNATAI